MTSPSVSSTPRLSRRASLAFVLAVASLGLVFIGAFFTPTLRRFLDAQGHPELWPVFLALTYFLPMLWGLLGAWLGGKSMGEIEGSEGQLYGDGFGVFAIMIGLLALITGGVITYARLIWGSFL